MAKNNPGLQGLRTALGSTFDTNGLGENMATLGRANQEEDQYYRDQREADQQSGMGGVLADAVHMGQQGGSIMEDPGMKVFLQALHEKNATIGKRSGLDLPDSPTGLPATYAPGQDSAVDPYGAAVAMRGILDQRDNPQYYISKALKGKQVQA